MGAAARLHLCDERSEEPCDNSTAPNKWQDCRGALLVSDKDGRRRLISAHRGARKCSLDACRRRYRQRVFALALAGMIEAQESGVRYVKLLTLTLPSPLLVPEEWLKFWHGWRGERRGVTVEVPPNSIHAYRYFAERFNRFQTAARRLWRYDYFRVVEEGSAQPYTTKRGKVVVGSERVHYHLLVMCERYMPQRKLSQLAEETGLGPITDIRAVKATEKKTVEEARKKVAAYLAAYAAKDGGLSTPFRLRFFATSHRWAQAYRAHLDQLRAEARTERIEAGRSATFVREQDIPALLETDPSIEDRRNDVARRAERPTPVLGLSHATNGTEPEFEVAA